jgi:hypothetical protein
MFSGKGILISHQFVRIWKLIIFIKELFKTLMLIYKVRKSCFKKTAIGSRKV